MTQVTPADKPSPGEADAGVIAENHRVQYYRLAPTVAARFVGLAFIVMAVYAFVGVIVLGIAGGDLAGVLVLLAVGVLAVAVFSWWLLARAYVVRCGPDGYRVRLVRGAGVKQASWSEVESATADTVRGIQVLVLHLTGGRTTSIPVVVLAIDKEEFVREMQRHLAAGQRITPIDG